MPALRGLFYLEIDSLVRDLRFDKRGPAPFGRPVGKERPPGEGGAGSAARVTLLFFVRQSAAEQQPYAVDLRLLVAKLTVQRDDAQRVLRKPCACNL